jgi:hypothetical protein
LLEVNENKLRKELAEARQRMSREPGNVMCVEPTARCLRWLGEPESDELFRWAAARYEEGVRAADERGRGDVMVASLLQLGLFQLLSENRDRAREWFERAYSELGPPEEVPWATDDYEDRIVLAFLLGRDEEVVQLQGAEAFGRENPWLDAMADISEARVSGDAALAGEAAEAVAELIRKSRIRVSDGPFGLHPWDQYEITLRAKAELEGRMNDATLRAPDLLRRERDLAESDVRRQISRKPTSVTPICSARTSRARISPRPTCKAQTCKGRSWTTLRDKLRLPQPLAPKCPLSRQISGDEARFWPVSSPVGHGVWFCRFRGE